jgi:long-chain acyl-CoA synthetase
MRIEQFLTESARRFPEKTALVAGGRRLSFAELDGVSDRVAAALVARGVARGERVVIFAENCWEAVAGLFAVAKAGAVFSLVNPTTKAEKLGHILANCRPAALIVRNRFLATVIAALARAPSVACCLVLGEAEGPRPRGMMDFAEALTWPGTPPRFPGIALDLAMLIYTSGSTGVPKGVMMTHANVAAASNSITTYLENTEDDVILNALPISFDYGLYQVLMAARLGATLVLEQSFAYPRAVFETMAAEGVTGFPIVPTMAALILQMRDLRPGSLPELRYITNTAAALPPAHIERLQDLFPRARLYSMYGLTECKRCTYLPPEQLQRRPGSVGIAIPGTEAYVVDEEGRRVGPGVVGELVIRGPHVMKGYWDDEAATARVLRPGPFPWEKVLHTGDLFRTDEEGFLYFVGRKDDIIKTRGEKVSPKEVENALYVLPGVREAAVVGVPDPVLGMALKAVIAADPVAGLTEREVIRHCARRLEDFMVPRLVEFRDTLPKTDTGKISRREVAESLSGG